MIGDVQSEIFARLFDNAVLCDQFIENCCTGCVYFNDCVCCCPCLEACPWESEIDYA